MKTFHFSGLAQIAAAAVLTSLAPIQAEEQQLLPSGKQSPHFSKVAGHLDLGGPIFTYVDVDGDFEEIVDFIQVMIGSMPPEASLPPEVAELDLDKLLKPLGFHGVKAKGMSSIVNADGSFHNKLFLYMPDGPKGLMGLLGDKPTTFHSPDLAPANAAIAMEQDVHLSKLKGMVAEILDAVGDPDIKAQFDEMLSQPAGPLPMSMGEMVDKMDTRITFILALDEATQLPVPEMDGVTFAAPDLLIAIDNAKWLADMLMESMPPEIKDTIVKGDGFQQLESPDPAGPGPFEIYKPIFHYDEKNGRLMVASRKSFLDSCLDSSQPKLRSAPEFVKAMKGLPDSGNGMAYVTPKLFEEIKGTIGKIEKLMGGQGEPQMTMALKIASALPLPKGTTASVQHNTPDGILFASNAGSSHKTTFYTAGMMPIMIPAMAAGFTYSTTAIGFEADMTRNMAELKQYDIGLQIYHQANDAYPPNLAVIAEEIGIPLNPELHYFAGYTNLDDPRIMLVAGGEGLDGSRMVLFNDHSVNLIDPSEFYGLLEKQQKAHPDKPIPAGLK